MEISRTFYSFKQGAAGSGTSGIINELFDGFAPANLKVILKGKSEWGHSNFEICSKGFQQFRLERSRTFSGALMWLYRIILGHSEQAGYRKQVFHRLAKSDGCRF